MAPTDGKIAAALRVQLLSLSATWIAGIYVNGFVPTLPGESAAEIIFTPTVELHIALAVLSAITSVLVIGLALGRGERRLGLVGGLASASIFLAGDSGLAYVLGGGSDAAESMIMATSFAAAVFFTFLAMAQIERAGRVSKMGTAVNVCYAAISLYFAVFVSGIYVNLYVAGPVFSLPKNAQQAALKLAEGTPAFLAHEVLGGVLLFAAVTAAVSLLPLSKGLMFGSALAAVLVAFSAYVGFLNLTSQPLTGTDSLVVSMLSSTGFVAALVITMLVAIRVRSGGRGP